MESTERIRKTLFEAGEIAAGILVKHFGALDRIDHKGDIDLVTVADMESEKAVIECIRKEFPGHAILAEESAHHGPAASDTRWIIDPLDGTTNFAHSFPGFAVSIGVEQNGELLFGLVAAPILKERFFAEKGKGASLNGRPISVSRVDSFGKALAATGFAYDRQTRADYYLKFVNLMMRRTQGIRRVGCASLDLCCIASGRFDVYWEENLNPWDVAAGALIVREAGGAVSDFSGEGFDLAGRQIAASNGILHQDLIQTIQQGLDS